MDVVRYYNSNAGVRVNLATGAASGGYANGDTFGGIEWLRGSQHNDRLIGDDGDNFLVGGAGADVLEGGEGVDYLGYYDSTAAVTVNLATGTATGGYASGDTFSGIQWVEGSRYDDHLTGDDGDNVLVGQAGADVLKWRLSATSDQPVEMMSLLKSPTGHVTNLSATGPGVMTATASSAVLINLSAHGGGTILLRDFDIADLDAADFVFESTEQRRSSELPAVHALELEDQGDSASWEGGAIEV